MVSWLRKRWLWMRLDTALLFVPEDLREVTLETWYSHSQWQQRENEQWEWQRKKDAQ